jgi:hypothetical protein
MWDESGSGNECGASGGGCNGYSLSGGGGNECGASGSGLKSGGGNDAGWTYSKGRGERSIPRQGNDYHKHIVKT